MSEELPSVVVIWKITNFRLWASRSKDELCSPYFSLNGNTESLFHWYLYLSREPQKLKNKVYGVYLKRTLKNCFMWSTVTLKFCFSICKMDGSIKSILKQEDGAYDDEKNDYPKSEDSEDEDNDNSEDADNDNSDNEAEDKKYHNGFTFISAKGGGVESFLDCDDQNLNTNNALLFAEDSIIIICKIWNENETTSKSQSGISLKRLTSYIPVTEKSMFVWEIKNALDLNIINEKRIFMEGDKLSVTLSYITLNGVKVIKAVMSGSVKMTSSWVCCLSCPHNKHFLFASGNLKKNDLPMEKVFEPCVKYTDILKNQRKYLTNESLVLNCSFSIIRDDLEYASWRDETISDPLMLHKIKNELEGKSNMPTLLGDLTQLYHDKTLSDFTLEVQSKSFSVHSSLLIARSEVFSQMLQTNMKEKTERKLTIEDIDENAVSGMLEFIYTDNPGSMNVEQALKLYYAGDKYKINGLVKKSSDFLVENLTISNVSDVLELADKHSDEELMSIVLKYILQHEKDILLSKEFEDFSKKNSSLAAQTWLSIAKLKYSSASDSAVKTPDDERKET